MAERPIYYKKTPDDLPGGNPICDFCAEPNPIMAYPADSFIISMITPEGTHTQDFGDDGWAACAWCAPLIDANDVARLVERYFVVHPMLLQLGTDERRFVRGLVSTQFDLFLEHQTGPGVPIDTAVTP